MLRGYGLLRHTFALASILMGADKFLHLLVDWDKYVAPALKRGRLDGGHVYMVGAGVVEILAGLLIWVAPRYGAYLVAALHFIFAASILIALQRSYFDIAARDLVLALGALALARMSPPGLVAFRRGNRHSSGSPVVAA
ncbi:MAG TPA: hypothetical protein VFX49_12270 [Chloroflexota bacterium]|nr:hypothetical protein [Chloroflexota bacterium]